MKTRNIIVIVILVIIVAGVILYFTVFKKDPKKEIIKIISTERSSDSEKSKMLEVVNKMSEQELKDTYALLKSTNSGSKINDPVLKARLDAISKKYGIFT